MLPSASSAAKTTCTVDAFPNVTAAGASEIARLCTTPLKVTFTTFAWSSTMVWVSVPVERRLPAPAAWSKSLTVKMSLPTGAETCPLHVVAEQPIVVGVDGLPPVAGATLTVADLVDAET